MQINASCSTLSDAASLLNGRTGGELSNDFDLDAFDSPNGGFESATAVQEIREVSLCRHEEEPYGLRVEAIGRVSELQS